MCITQYIPHIWFDKTTQYILLLVFSLLHPTHCIFMKAVNDTRAQVNSYRIEGNVEDDPQAHWDSTPRTRMTTFEAPIAWLGCHGGATGNALHIRCVMDNLHGTQHRRFRNSNTTVSEVEWMLSYLGVVKTLLSSVQQTLLLENRSRISFKISQYSWGPLLKKNPFYVLSR